MSDSSSAISNERLLAGLGFNGSPLGDEVDELFAGKEYTPTELSGEGWTGRVLERSMQKQIGAGILRISDVRTWFDHDGQIKDRRALIFTELDGLGNPTSFVRGFTIND